MLSSVSNVIKCTGFNRYGFVNELKRKEGISHRSVAVGVLEREE